MAQSSCQGPHLGWLQFPAVWQSVNKETRDVHHWLTGILLGSLKACHVLFIPALGKETITPLRHSMTIDQSRGFTHKYDYIDQR